jgi:hypothetical protein
MVGSVFLNERLLLFDRSGRLNVRLEATAKG